MADRNQTIYLFQSSFSYTRLSFAMMPFDITIFHHTPDTHAHTQNTAQHTICNNVVMCRCMCVRVCEKNRDLSSRIYIYTSLTPGSWTLWQRALSAVTAFQFQTPIFLMCLLTVQPTQPWSADLSSITRLAVSTGSIICTAYIKIPSLIRWLTFTLWNRTYNSSLHLLRHTPLSNGGPNTSRNISLSYT